MPDVSVIIVNYRTPYLTVEAIRSLRAVTRRTTLEFIVVDNDSGDDSQRIIREAIPGVIWHQTGHNAGFGRASNAGMRLAQGRYFLLLNADTLQTGDVLDECVRRLNAEPGIAACAPIQLYADGHPMPYHRSFAGLLRTLYILPSRAFFQKVLNRLTPENQYPDPRQCDWLVGAFLLVRREAVLEAGYFDERFFMYAEDVEWGNRLGKAGKLCYFSDLGFIHLENQSDLRRNQPTYINRFGVQNQVSNLLWVRTHYGVLVYLSIIFNYLALIPPFFGWKVLVNVLKKREPLSQLDAQRLFARKVRVLLHYFWPILLNWSRFYKIAPTENIQ
ncbi:MAG: glycosyltransferase family 2 protein [Cytophagaceae bacterium]|nr:glycosyltransferase family 2 protein [Cytophagaceae bacterium]